MHMRHISKIALPPALFVALVFGCGAGDSSVGTNPPNDDPSKVDGGGEAGVGIKSSKPLLTPSHGSTSALSDDDSRLVVANPDAGTVSVFSVDWAGPIPALTKTAELPVGAEAWQVVIHPDGDYAFVIARKAQKLTRIDNLKTAPSLGPQVAVGSEPTGIAMAPSGATVWVANMVDGTVMGVATGSMSVDTTIDLNATIAASGLLGPGLAARPSLAHPRGIAMSNNGDMVDTDESLYVTDFYAVQKTALATDGSNVATSRVGVLYKVALGSKQASIIELPPMADIGFKDLNGLTIPCYPNQIGSVIVQGGFGYVNSICASSRGPTGLSTGPAASTCTTEATCPGAVAGTCVAGKCTTNCTTDAQCGVTEGKCGANFVCEPNPANVRKLSAPIVSIVDLGGAKTIATVNLAKEFHTWYGAGGKPDDATRRLPLNPLDIGFIPGTVTAYFPASGTDAVFRVDFDASYAASTINSLGDPKGPFINLAPAGVDPSRMGRVPTGIAMAHKTHTDGSDARFAFVANDATRNVSVLDLANHQVAGLSAGTPQVVQSAALPTDATQQAILEGKRLFLTGLGRWSWKGQGWGACTTCHADGLSDNVTWYLGGGPGQSPTFESLYDKKNPTDVRVNLWRGKLDEPSDHEGAIRSILGGVGAIVKDPALDFTSRMTFSGGLNGSSLAAANPANPAGLPQACVLDDWMKLVSWMKIVRSPRRPTNLDAQKVAAGQALYKEGGCQGCHSGSRWTISHVFYNVDATDAVNAKLKTTSWAAAVTTAGVPINILPTTDPAMQMMRYPGTVAGIDQLTCMLRSVGTYGVGEPGVGVLEVKGTDMVTAAQGNETFGRGFNTPSLLGNQLGAPYFHAGHARTLEAALSETFAAHLRAINPGFLAASDPERGSKLASLIQYVLSIDEEQTPIATPALGPGGGDFCTPPAP